MARIECAGKEDEGEHIQAQERHVRATVPRTILAAELIGWCSSRKGRRQKIVLL